eukprot:scaffold12953_cov96-Isochrysis_galbana.AAC.7
MKTSSPSPLPSEHRQPKRCRLGAMLALMLKDLKIVISPMFVYKAGSTEWISLLELHLSGRCAPLPSGA